MPRLTAVSLMYHGSILCAAFPMRQAQAGTELCDGCAGRQVIDALHETVS